MVVVCLILVMDFKTDLISWPYEEIPDQQFSFFDSTHTHLDWKSQAVVVVVVGG